MLLEEAFIMAVLFRKCERKLQLFPSNLFFRIILLLMFYFKVVFQSRSFWGICINNNISLSNLSSIFFQRFVQCQTGTRNCNISAERKRNYQRSSVQNQGRSRVDSICSINNSLRWLFFKSAAVPLQSQGDDHSLPNCEMNDFLHLRCNIFHRIGS